MKYCDDLGIPADKSSTLFLFLGIFAALGRLGGGFLCNMRFIKAGFLQQAATFIVGSSTMLLTLAKTYVAVVTYVITFAIADGMMVTSVIIECMELVEDSKRASTFGFFMLFGGIVGMTSPPFAGSLSLINISCVLITLLSHPITGNPIISSIHPSLSSYLAPSVRRTFFLSFRRSIGVHLSLHLFLHQFQFLQLLNHVI